MYPSKHKQSDWSLEIKNVYDTFPDLKFIYSGSSILQLYKGKGDLSRRKAGYLMPGLSFREYLAHGYYPFYSGDIGIYQSWIRDVVNLIIDTDLPYVASVSPKAREQLKTHAWGHKHNRPLCAESEPACR